MAIDRLPSGSFRARLMIDGRRYTGTLPTEADARLWEIETRAVAVGLRRAASVTFAAYAERWLAGFIDDAPDRAQFEAVLEHRLVPALGDLPLLEVLEKDRDGLERRLVDAGGDGDDDTTRQCLLLILGDAVGDLRAGVLDVGTASGPGPSLSCPVPEPVSSASR
ncbi:MAG: hypothetical protein ACQEUI_13485 [Actinomycetota bacterium]